jgi:hypothetical protein
MANVALGLADSSVHGFIGQRLNCLFKIVCHYKTSIFLAVVGVVGEVAPAVDLRWCARCHLERVAAVAKPKQFPG